MVSSRENMAAIRFSKDVTYSSLEYVTSLRFSRQETGTVVQNFLGTISYLLVKVCRNDRCLSVNNTVQSILPMLQ